MSIVVGGTRGIGLRIAERLAETYGPVVVLGRSVRSDEIENDRIFTDDDSKMILPIRCDVTRSEDVVRAMKEARESLGRPIVTLVNAAGTNRDGLLARTTDKDIREMMDTNAVGVLYACRTFSKMYLRDVRECEEGASVVNVGSVVGGTGNSGQTVYSASKSALRGLTRSLAQELGPRGVRVNMIEPGFVSGGMTENLSAEHLDRVQKRTALGRLGTADDVANVALFLAGPDSSFVTGQVFGVDGGLRL